MDKEILELHAGFISLAGLGCTFIIVQALKFLEEKEKLEFWMLLVTIIVGIYAGYGFVRIYLHFWSPHDELRIGWLGNEFWALLAAGYVIFLSLYTLIIALGAKEPPIN